MRLPKIIFSLGFLLLGLIFVGGSIFLLTRPKVEYKETVGTIVELEEYWEPGIDDTSISYHVYIDYEVGGQKFEHVEYGSYSTGMKVGDTVKVYYDPAHPEQYQAEGFEVVPYVVGGAGLVAIIVAIVIFFRR